MPAGALVIVVALWLLAFAGGAAAADGVPAHTSLVVDEADVLTADDSERLLERLRAIQSSGRAQLSILIANGTAGVPLADYSLRVAESWALGRASRDDGLLILVVPSTNSARLEVGYGLEGDIPDARVSQWLDDLVPAIRNGEIAGGLHRLLDRIDDALPQKPAPKAQTTIFDEHPEWGPPFALAVFSLFALFPLFMGRWGSIASAVLLAAFLGGAAFMFWSSESAGIAVAAVAFVLPFLWGLNHEDHDRLPAWVRYLKNFGNLIGVAMFFSIITLFVGVGVSAMGEPWWWGAGFSGLLSLGLATLLFPGAPAHYLQIVLRSAMQFTFVLIVVAVSMLPITPDPSRLAFLVATASTAIVGLGLYLDSRPGKSRWSPWCYGLAILAVAPFALLALFLSIGGEDGATAIAQLVAGGGSIAGLVAFAARVGLIAAVKIGLGGRFGGGGAGRSG